MDKPTDQTLDTPKTDATHIPKQHPTYQRKSK